MQKWEYMRVDAHNLRGVEFNDKDYDEILFLNGCGDQGWELVSSIRCGPDEGFMVYHFLKRPKE